jgi:hypothetical protein
MSINPVIPSVLRTQSYDNGFDHKTVTVEQILFPSYIYTQISIEDDKPTSAVSSRILK